MASRKLTVIIAGDSRALERAFGRAQKSAVSFTGRMTRDLRGVASSLGIVAGAGGLLGVTLALKDATEAAADFEVTMQKVVGLSGVAQGKIAGLSGEILKLAPQVGKGPQELAEALQFITSSGIDADHAMGVLEFSAKAAAAGLGETKTVADAVTSVMNAYGASVVNAKSATDTLVATVREGKGEASDFAGVIGNVTAIAAQLGVSFNDVGAALAAMTRLGTDAETASTQLQQVFSNLVKVSPQQAKAFKEVGLSAAGLRKELKEQGLLATLKTIQTAFAGNIPGLAKAFGDIRALRGVLALVGNQAEQTRGIFQRMGASAGSLGDAFKAIAGTSAQQFARFNAAVDATRITIGSALAPAAEKAATAVANWLSVSKNQERVQRDVQSAVKAVVNISQSAISAFRDLRDIIEPIVRAMGGLANAAKLLLAALIASKIVAFADSIAALGRSTAVTTGRVTALRLALTRLSIIGPILIGVEVLLNKDTIDKKVNSFLQRNHAGFLTAQAKKIPIGVDVTDLDKARQALINMGQAGDLGERSLGLVADRLRQVGTEANKALDAASKIEAGRAARPGKSNTFANAFGGVLDFVSGQVDDALTSTQEAIRKQRLAAEKVRKAATAAAERQRKAFDAIADSLGLKVDQDLFRNNFAKALADNSALQAAIRKQIASEGNTTDLARQLFEAQRARADILTQQAQAAADAREKAAEKAAAAQKRVQAAQFKALGLTAEGDQRTPGVANLKKQLSQLTQNFGQEFTPKIKSQLAGVAKVLSGALGKVTLESRQKIKELFDAIRDEFKEQSKGPLTKTTSLNSNKLLEGLGLGADQIRELRSRLSGFNSAGLSLAPQAAGTVGAFGMLVPAQTTTVNTTIELDGRVVARNTTKHQQVRARRNPPQKRGPHGI